MLPKTAKRKDTNSQRYLQHPKRKGYKSTTSTKNTSTTKIRAPEKQKSARQKQRIVTTVAKKGISQEYAVVIPRKYRKSVP